MTRVDITKSKYRQVSMRVEQLRTSTRRNYRSTVTLSVWWRRREVACFTSRHYTTNCPF